MLGTRASPGRELASHDQGIVKQSIIAALTMNEREPSKKITLAEFIEENSKLVTSFAAFVALAAFSLQLDKPEVKIGISAAALLGALLLVIELFWRVPPREAHWRLRLFDLVLLGLFSEMAWYWCSRFKEVWILALIGLAPLFIFLLICGLLTYALEKAGKTFVSRVLKRDLSEARIARVRLISVISSLILLVGGCLWAARRLGGHEIRFPF
jgi:hypothetical protein